MSSRQEGKRDAYRRVATFYDGFFESMNKGLRLAGLRMCRPTEGMTILDVGCGTGTYLELFQGRGCRLFGIDHSPAMLAVARERLADSVKLDLGDATKMPYEEDTFDFILCMLVLHEMPPEARGAVVGEMKRVLKAQGQILLTDFNLGPIQSFQGWISKLVITLSELLAGQEHYRSYRHFMSNGGLASLASELDLEIEMQRTLAGGTFSLYLTSPRR